jgi:hypothetical protein
MLTRVRTIYRHIEKLNAELKAIQETCLHPRVEKTPHSDTGNYDPSCDRYWYDCECPDCDLYWTEDQ